MASARATTPAGMCVAMELEQKSQLKGRALPGCSNFPAPLFQTFTPMLLSATFRDVNAPIFFMAAAIAAGPACEIRGEELNGSL